MTRSAIREFSHGRDIPAGRFEFFELATGRALLGFSIPASFGLHTSERISDVPHGLGSVNPVYHEKFHVHTRDIVSGFPYDTATGGRFVPPECGSGLITGYANVGDRLRPLVPNAPSCTGPFMLDFVHRTLEQWTPTGPTEDDIATDVLEFGQNIDALKFQFQLVKDLITSSVLPNILRPKAWIDEFLIKEFGYNPLIGGISTVIGIADSASRRLSFLKNTRGRTVTLHSSKMFKDPAGAVVDLGSVVSPSPYIYDYLTSHEVKVSLGCRLYHLLYGLDDAWAQWSLIKAKLGLSRPFTSEWNRVKYSFVVDWVFDVSHYLDMLDFSNLDFYGEWDINPIWHSYKTKAQIHGVYYPSSISAYQIVRETDVSIYSRHLGLPAFAPYTGLTRFQTALAAALAGQRILPNLVPVSRQPIKVRAGKVWPTHTI